MKQQLLAVGVIAAIAAILYLGHCLYWFIMRQKASNVGIFCDDRRENDQR
jgi:hypothetical protein